MAQDVKVRSKKQGMKERDDVGTHKETGIVCKECEMLSGSWYVPMMQAVRNRRSTGYRHWGAFWGTT